MEKLAICEKQKFLPSAFGTQKVEVNEASLSHGQDTLPLQCLSLHRSINGLTGKQRKNSLVGEGRGGET